MSYKTPEDREAQIRQIGHLWALPSNEGGEEQPTSVTLLAGVLDKLGYAALTDEAVAMLCAAHQHEDWRLGELAEAAYQRSLRRA